MDDTDLSQVTSKLKKLGFKPEDEYVWRYPSYYGKFHKGSHRVEVDRINWNVEYKFDELWYWNMSVDNNQRIQVVIDRDTGGCTINEFFHSGGQNKSNMSKEDCIRIFLERVESCVSGKPLL
jgi:hypothetical protein